MISTIISLLFLWNYLFNTILWEQYSYFLSPRTIYDYHLQPKELSDISKPSLECVVGNDLNVFWAITAIFCPISVWICFSPRVLKRSGSMNYSVTYCRSRKLSTNYNLISVSEFEDTDGSNEKTSHRLIC